MEVRWSHNPEMDLVRFLLVVTRESIIISILFCLRGAMEARRSSKPEVAGSSPVEGYAIRSN